MIEKGKWYRVRKGSMPIEKRLIGTIFKPEKQINGNEWYGTSDKGLRVYFYSDELVPIEERKEDKEYLDLFV